MKRYYCETRKVSCGQFLRTVTQASKAKDEAASLRGELRLARSEQADRFILAFSFFFRFLAFDFRPASVLFLLFLYCSSSPLPRRYFFLFLLRPSSLPQTRYFLLQIFSLFLLHICLSFSILLFLNQNVFLLFYYSFLATTTICFHKFWIRIKDPLTELWSC